MNIGYQKYTLEQLRKHNKSILIWFRQSGKTTLLINNIVDYLSNNNNKNVLIISPRKIHSEHFQKILANKLEYSLSGATCKHKKNKSTVNDSTIYFESVNTYRKIIPNEDIDYILIDNFEFIKNYDFVGYIERKKCKVLLCSSQIINKMMLNIDVKCDYYLNFVSFPSVATVSEIENRMKKYDAEWLYSIENDYVNEIIKLYDEFGERKNKDLIFIWGIKEERRLKMEEISKKINDENED
jgi:molybdopterin-guanine dinucleotide biosynthesis protein